MGAILAVAGVVITVVGLLLWKGWLGRLPGDITVERGNFGFFFPIVTCLVISIVLTLFFWLLRR